MLAAAAWVALFESGVDPIVLGLAMGLITWAYPAGRGELERATDLFRGFREQPTPELARSAQRGLQSAVSPNARLQQLYHPWTSYVIVPLFALANAGIVDRRRFPLSWPTPRRSPSASSSATWSASRSGSSAVSWLLTRLSRGRLRPPVGWAAVVGGATIAGIGFTVSLLIATLAFRGPQLQEAKLGVLTAAVGGIPADLARLPRDRSCCRDRLRVRAMLGRSETLVDLAVPVDPSATTSAVPRKRR